MDISEGYAKTCSISMTDTKYFLTKYGHLLKWKNYKENILDVGCADGSVTRNILFPFLENHVETLEAIDKLESMIELAKSRNDIKEIEFKAIDINTQEYAESKKFEFDHIFSFYCIHWVVDTRSLFNRFYNMLKPGGQLFIATVSDTPVHRAFKKYTKEGSWSKYLQTTDSFADYSQNPEKYIQNLLESVGFHVDLCKFEKLRGIIENYTDFSRSLVNMSDLVVQVPQKMREKYIEDHVEGMRESGIYLGHPNKYEVFYETITFVASKRM